MKLENAEVKSIIFSDLRPSNKCALRKILGLGTGRQQTYSAGESDLAPFRGYYISLRF